MSEEKVFEFPQKGNVQPLPVNMHMSSKVSAWRCVCGNIYWFLYTDGRVRCTACHTDVRLKVEKV